ncbi:glucosaminidase domain-containing protein [Flexithrix dorotheae]|uniref:glucosaminidase domain-containing protein n=1 Tax=Flexithrix dorotheae TaxID=70993 RepID=UPI000368FB42|nr:glucosaminidase domain-containing protein [Flexithrix dorotheae]
MKTELRLKLPFKLIKQPAHVGIRGRAAYFEYNGGKDIILIDSIYIAIFLGLIPFMIVYFSNRTQNIKNVYTLVQQSEPIDKKLLEQKQESKDSDKLEFPLDFELEDENLQIFQNASMDSYRTKFIKKREKLIYEFKYHNNIWRLDQMDETELLEINKKIANLFIDEVLNNVNPEPHVYKFFTDSTDLHKVETALMEQVKFNVPASIKLAQSALETSYGRRVINNNYFGIKDKSRSTNLITTTEYYNDAELKKNKHKVVSKTLIDKNGKKFWKCTVKDHFQAYSTPWQSFRAHSIYLFQNKRYAPLFRGGRKYQDWADNIGSTKYGGVGYATSPIYGKILKGIIKRYNLDLLDF